MHNRGRTALLFAAATTVMGAAFAASALAVPVSIRYTGHLSDAQGPVDGTVALTVGLYGEATGGGAAWSDSYAEVAVADGVFEVLVGSTQKPLDSVLLSDDSLWIELKVGSTTLSPRQRLTSVPYARFAANAAAIGGIPASAWATKSDLAEKVIAPETLPNNGLNVVSNGAISNTFMDVVAAMEVPEGGVDIPDNEPQGVTVQLATSESPGSYLTKFAVHVVLQLKVVSQVKIVLTPPATSGIPSVQLFSGTIAPQPGSSEFSLLLTTDDIPALAQLINQDPSGVWTLNVSDNTLTVINPPLIIGQIAAFELLYDIVRSDHVQVLGDVTVAQGVTMMGELNVTGNFAFTQSAGIECNAATSGTLRYDFTAKQLQICTGTGWAKLGAAPGATYRWAQWSTYDQNAGWFANDNAALFGGVNPSQWGNGDALAHQISSDSEVLRTLFINSGPAIGTLKNANVVSDEWFHYSSTNSKHAGALFRVKNTTEGNIVWPVTWFRTAYSGWNERASIAINGSLVWESAGSNFGGGNSSSHNITIPANRTSTVIFVAASSSDSGTRANVLLFANNCLVLPAGLELVDDLDTKPNGWTN